MAKFDENEVRQVILANREKIEETLRVFRETKAADKSKKLKYPDFFSSCFSTTVQHIKESISSMVSRFSNLNRNPKLILNALITLDDEGGSFVSTVDPTKSRLSKDRAKRYVKKEKDSIKKLFLYSIDSKLFYPYKLVWANGDVRLMRDVMRAYLLQTNGDPVYLEQGGTSSALIAVVAHEMTHIANVHTFDEDMADMALFSPSGVNYITSEIDSTPSTVRDTDSYNLFASFLRQRLRKTLLFQSYGRDDNYARSIAEMEAGMSMLWTSMIAIIVQLQIWLTIETNIILRSRNMNLSDFMISLINEQSELGRNDLVKAIMAKLGEHYLKSPSGIKGSEAWRIAAQAIQNIKPLLNIVSAPLTPYGKSKYGIFFTLDKLFCPEFITFITFTDFIASFASRMADYLQSNKKTIEKRAKEEPDPLHNEIIKEIHKTAFEIRKELLYESLVDATSWLRYVSAFYATFKNINIYLIAAAEIFKILVKELTDEKDRNTLLLLHRMFERGSKIKIKSSEYKVHFNDRENSSKEKEELDNIFNSEPENPKDISQVAPKEIFDMPIAGLLSSKYLNRKPENLNKLAAYIVARINETGFLNFGHSINPTELQNLPIMLADVIFRKDDAKKDFDQFVFNAWNMIEKDPGKYNSMFVLGAAKRFNLNYDLLINIISRAFPSVKVQTPREKNSVDIKDILINRIRESVLNSSASGDMRYAGQSLLITWAFMDVAFNSIGFLFKEFVSILRAHLRSEGAIGYDEVMRRFLDIMRIYFDENNSNLASLSAEQQKIAYKNNMIQFYQNVLTCDSNRSSYLDSRILTNVWRSCLTGFNVSDNGLLMYYTAYEYALFGSLISGIELKTKSSE